MQMMSNRVSTGLDGARAISSLEHLKSLLLRGGRMTKVAGVAASYAPQLGVAAIAAAPLLLSGVTVAYADPMPVAGCAPDGGSGTYLCSGEITTTQSLSPPAGQILTVNTTEQISIVTATGNALNLSNSAGDFGLSFTDTYGSTITGATAGISARNNGFSSLSITTTGDVTGINGRGIDAYHSANGGDLTIEAAAVTGRTNGIYANNKSSGGVSITASGSVASTTNDGIYANNSSAGTGVTIQAVDVTSGNNGIRVANNGSGALSITTTGDVVSTHSARIGIQANNSSSGTDLTINAATATGGNYGIYANNRGSGATSVTASGTITSNAYHGLFIQNSGTDLTIQTAAVTGAEHGISAKNTGSGALSITTTGDVEGTGQSGVFADSGGTDLTIQAANVSGGKYGIFGFNEGSGGISITATGTVTGTTEVGINAQMSASGSGDLTIQAADVTGNFGVVANSFGSSAVSITTTGDVTGTGASGILGTARGTDLTIQVAKVTGAAAGIIANVNGTGALSITASGDVTGGSGFNGIDADVSSGGTDLTIQAANVTGGDTGIYAYNEGSGATSITLSGDIMGGTGAGVYTYGRAGGEVGITLNKGSSVAATSGIAIRDYIGDATVTVNAGSAIIGAVQLGDGSDTLILAGGDVSGVTSFDGGDDSSVADGFIDTVRVAGMAQLGGANFTNFEQVKIERGGTIVVPAGTRMESSGNIVFEAGSQFRVGVASAMDAGQLVGNDGAITFNAGSEVFADVTQGLELDADTAIQVAMATGGVTDSGLSVDDNSALIDFRHEVRGGNGLFLVVEQTLSATETTTTNNGRTNAESIAAAIDALIDSAPANNPIVQYLAQFPVAEQPQRLFELVKASLPSEVDAAGSSTVASTDLVLDLIMDRLSGGGAAVADSGSGQSGIAAGEKFLGGPGNWALWGQAGASFAEYEPSAVNGFDADTYGVTVGMDGDIAQDLRMGLAVYYSDTSVDENGAGANSNQDIEGYGVLLYGTYNPADFYVNGTVGFGLNEYDSQRLAAGGVNQANYDGTQLTGRVEVGKTFTEGNWNLSPHVGLRYSKVSIDGYTETGPLPTSIDSQSLTSLRGVLGLSGRYTHELESGARLVPEAYIRGLQELAGPNGATTGNIVGGGTFVSQTTARDNFSAALGGGLGYELDDQFSVRLLYDGEFQTDYQEHSLSASIRYQF
jgi:outer membrane autotransporter protein